MFRMENQVKTFCLLLFVAFALLSINAQAAEEKAHSAGLMIGQAWPSGEIGKDVDGNVAPGIFYEYAASDVFSLYTNYLYSTHTNSKLTLGSSDLGIKANLVNYDKLSPYAFLGMGLYFVNKRIGAANEIASATLFGFNLGTGADLDLSDRFYIGMFFTFHNMFAKTLTLPIAGNTELSGRWAGIFLRGGVRF